MLQVFAIGFSLGLLGSLHCLGMCGPIALSLPVSHLSPAKKYWGILLYNAGRVFTYMMLGLLFAIIGHQLFIGPLQQYLSIAAGVVIMLSVLPFIAQYNISFPFYRKFISKLQSEMAQQLRSRKSLAVLLLIGFLNGLLPCGLVYVALAGAAASGDPLKGMAWMMGFGAATWPVMMAVSVYGKKMISYSPVPVKRVLPILIFSMGVLFVVRGMNLGIPYLSPKIEQTASGTHAACCHKP